jgi:DNA-binding transcriptional MerR regulator
MSHEIAKLLLEHAETFLDRQKAIKTALSLGMTLQEIEEYLDFMELLRAENDRRNPPEG